MAAMEQLEIHSKSYLIRWVNCAPGYTISWSIKPHKKSLNFGIFKHPGSGTQAQQGGTAESLLQPPTPSKSEEGSSQRSVTSRGRSYEGDCKERLHAVGLLDVYWHGKCEAEKVTTGFYNVKGQGGMFALVFDNTFSKQISKHVTVILLTYPSNNPPPASHHLPHADSAAGTSTSSLPSSSKQSAAKSGSASLKSGRVSPEADHSSIHSTATGFYTGILKKRKRKRHQGFARRYFSLDFTTSTLSYYLNKESSALRGAIPLSLAAISASEKEREICIDSGAEVWHLRASSQAEWDGWKNALERAAAQAHKQTTHAKESDKAKGQANEEEEYPITSHAALVQEDKVWAEVEALVGRVAGVRDAVRRLASSTTVPSALGDPERSLRPERDSSTSENPGSPVASSPPAIGSGEKKSFWKRKGNGTVSPHNLQIREADRKSISAIATISASALAHTLPNGGQPPQQQNDISANLIALLTDLNNVVSDFSTLITENKHKRWIQHRRSEFVVAPPAAASASRNSMDTTASEEFFDAYDGPETAGKVAILNDDSDGEKGGATGADSTENRAPSLRTVEGSDDDESGESEDGSYESPDSKVVRFDDLEATTQTTDLYPLPLNKTIVRRDAIPASTVMPPSLIGFLRKNVGKDLSTIAMPVSANEPISLLQRLAEQLEYSELLDQAVNAPNENGRRLLHIAAFAVSGFSNIRAKERAIRKPFNPMLGETYELVREDKGFRFLAEKVSHRPVVMACQADSKNWTFSQSPMPTQKFWGKSAELNTVGRVRIHLSTGDNYFYTIATSFLRNIIAGTKYVEPVGTMSVYHENSGEKAVVTFKQKTGMFADRSDEVVVQVFDCHGNVYPLSLMGKWTADLTLYEHVAERDQLVERGKIWQVGQLVEQFATRYGFTKFAASLNAFTAIEEGIVAPTDSRLRPDQRLVEEVKLDEAEVAKSQLEEKQRQRRREMEEAGKTWVPRWFVKVREYENEEVWRIKSGKESYWEMRKNGNRDDYPTIF